MIFRVDAQSPNVRAEVNRLTGRLLAMLIAIESDSSKHGGGKHGMEARIGKAR